MEGALLEGARTASPQIYPQVIRYETGRKTMSLLFHQRIFRHAVTLPERPPRRAPRETTAEFGACNDGHLTRLKVLSAKETWSC